MSNPFALARKYLSALDSPSQPNVAESNTIHAVKICSHVLEDEIWLVFDRSFTPMDGLAVYYPEEISELGKKTPEQLREIHKVKLVFPGARVIQEGADAGNRK